MPGVNEQVKQKVIDLMRAGDMEEFVKANIDKLFENQEMPELPPIAQYVQKATDEALSVLDWALDRQVRWRQQFKPDGSANANIVREIVAGGFRSVHDRHRVTDPSPLPKSEQEKVVQGVLALPGLTAEWNKTLETLIELDHPLYGRSEKQAKHLEKEFGVEFSVADADGNGTVKVTELAAFLNSKVSSSFASRATSSFESQATQIVSFIDLDGNGVISREEYIAHRFREKNIRHRLRNRMEAEREQGRAQTPEDAAEVVLAYLRARAKDGDHWMRKSLSERGFVFGAIEEHLRVRQPKQSSLLPCY
eukprot:COSAG06_NODE_961_length_11312_cov_10.559351_5_plen_307_part_00